MNKILFTLFLIARRAVYLSLLGFDKLAGRSNKLFILSYHSVASDNGRFSIDPEVIKKQLTYLKKTYKVLSLADVEAILKGTKKLTRPSVVITFDDGYKDILTLQSFLKKHNMKPALFVLSDAKRANWKELGTKRAFLSNKDIKALKKAGWEIGCHSATHANLAELSGKKLTDEIVTAKKTLEKSLGTNIAYFAYPRGKYSQAVLKAVKKAEYALGLTMDDGSVMHADSHLLPRVGIDRTHSFIEFKAAFSPSVIAGRKLIKESYLGRFI